MTRREGSSAVAIGIDAAVVAKHHIIVRRPEAGRAGEVIDDFTAGPTLAGLDALAKRLSTWPGAIAVAEPTSMTWLPLAVTLGQAGVDLALVGNRHSARLRSALAGKNKSDPIDAQVLSRAGEFFELAPARIPTAPELALRRAVQRRGKAIVDANRCLRRVISLARWAFPDVWDACSGSRSTAIGILTRWPRVDALGRARTSSIIEVVAAHTRGVADVERRATAIRDAAGRWTDFWVGHLDFDALGWEVAELVADLAAGEERIERAGVQAQRYWEEIYGDDRLLLSVPGMGPRTGPVVRAFLGNCSHFGSAKQAQAYVGLNPSNWASGQTASPSRGITKEGPSVLRLAFYQAANVARVRDPQLAEFYRRLMVERGHCHTKANCAVARKLVARTWSTLTTGAFYELRNVDGTPVTRAEGARSAATYAVSEDVRRRSRSHSAATHRGRLTR